MKIEVEYEIHDDGYCPMCACCYQLWDDRHKCIVFNKYLSSKKSSTIEQCAECKAYMYNQKLPDGYDIFTKDIIEKMDNKVAEMLKKRGE